MNNYTPGEYVTITIKNAIICETYDNRIVIDSCENMLTINLAPDVIIDRVAPKEWPPLIGDIWAINGEYHVARLMIGDGEPSRIVLDPIVHSDYGDGTQEIGKTIGKNRLVLQWRRPRQEPIPGMLRVLGDADSPDILAWVETEPGSGLYRIPGEGGKDWPVSREDLEYKGIALEEMPAILAPSQKGTDQ